MLQPQPFAVPMPPSPVGIPPVNSWSGAGMLRSNPLPPPAKRWFRGFTAGPTRFCGTPRLLFLRHALPQAQRLLLKFPLFAIYNHSILILSAPTPILLPVGSCQSKVFFEPQRQHFQTLPVYAELFHLLQLCWKVAIKRGGKYNLRQKYNPSQFYNGQ